METKTLNKSSFHNNTIKEEGENCIDDCIVPSFLSPLHPHYASYNMLNQDIDDQIATINSLTISDQPHPMDTMLDTRSAVNSTPFRSIFTETSTAFAPQSTDRHLFRNSSFSVQPDYGDTPNSLFMNYDQHQLSRRESYPNMSTSYNMDHPTEQNNNFDWNPNHGYMQSTSEQSSKLYQQQQQYYRKFSMDVPPSFIATSKRLDNGRLSPSYSNPDLASSARRMGSLDAGTTRLAATARYGEDNFDDYMIDKVPRKSSLFNYTTTYDQLPSMESSPQSPFISSTTPATTTTSTMNPLLAAHLMRQMQSTSYSRPPSPTNSRKNSIQQQLRRTSSATTMNTTANPEVDRFAFIRLEDVVDEIYSLCKDQYGCRFFQKKLEEKMPEQNNVIFLQIYPHFVELMTDPFGNYLCQKLMEYCSDAQRTMMIEAVSQAIVPISLNMHGTRAVQKMIEFLTLPEQIQKTIEALSPNVVTLIKDINGNHVIQKCLHRLASKDKQFIYDAVSDHCIEVATHRHGCCVLQRCIDFSAESQKKQLVNEIIRHALTLVQDPYGNYVVQYVLELGDAQFSDQLIRQFIGHLGSLSVQKYSSNVMEKCIRVAEDDTRRQLIEEMVNMQQLEKLLKDSYANYVVQTALDFADVVQHQKLGECIRPLLSGIRNTSYCKRIQGKLNNRGEQQRPPHHQQTFPYPQYQQKGYMGGGANDVHPLMNHTSSFASYSFPQ